jgi:hypothetical protein
MEVANVIIAIGQVVDKTALPPELEYTGLGTIVVDPTTLQTNIEGVFAGGDVVSGPSDVIAAVAGGKEAAISIDKYLGGEGVLPVEEIKVKDPTSRNTFLERWQEKREVEVSIVDGSVSVSVEKKRAEMPTLPLEKRLGGFDEVELGLTQEMAIAEGQRCWRCDLEE